MEFSARFDVNEVHILAARYTASNSDAGREERIETIVGPAAEDRGWFGREEFLEVCYWKTPRSSRRCELNAPDFIREVTSVALSTENERLRIEVLTLLHGVSWPTASVLLHFAHRDRYPILDFRALEALGVDGRQNYSFELWWEYVKICRALADKAGVTMRTLDRAMWWWSKTSSATFSP